MDGFNLIPGSSSDQNTQTKKNESTKTFQEIATAQLTNKKPQTPDKGIKIITKEDLKNESNTVSNYFFSVAIVILLMSLGYAFFLIGSRYYTLNRIQNISAQLISLEGTIDKKEVEEYRILSQKVNSIKNRLSKHFIHTDILNLVNQNMRSSVQVYEYKVDVTDTDLIASYSCMAPSFKDMAEQTERLFDLRSKAQIKSFSLSSLSYEQDTKRVRYTIKVNLDKSKFSAENYVGITN